MPHIEEPLRVTPLPKDVRKDSLLGGEVTLPTGMKLLDLDALSEQDKKTLREGVFNNGVIVIRGQDGMSPAVMPKIGKFFDESAWDVHSGGPKMVTDKKNILSQNNGARVPRAQQVSVIGKGKWYGHEGIPELDLKHVVSLHLIHCIMCWTVLILFLEPYRVPRKSLIGGRHRGRLHQTISMAHGCTSV